MYNLEYVPDAQQSLDDIIEEILLEDDFVQEGETFNGDSNFGLFGIKIRINLRGPLKWIGNAARCAGRAAFKGVGAIGKGITKASQLVGKVPIIGGPLHSVMSLAGQPFRVAEAAASGANIGKLALDSFKENVAAVRSVAPVAQMVVGIVPGVGGAVSGALAVGIALSDGRPITEAMQAAAKAAIPGGALAAAAFEVTQAAIQGKNIIKAGLSTALKQLPAEAQKALNVVQQAAAGGNIAKIALQQAVNALPPTIQKAAMVGIAVGEGKKLQTIVANNIQNLPTKDLKALVSIGQKAAAINPVYKITRNLAKQGVQGYDLGMGLMSRSGVNELTIMQFRKKLSPKNQAGFDLALSTKVGAVVSPPPPQGLPAAAQAAYYTTKGMVSADNTQKKELMDAIAKNPEAQKGVEVAAREIVANRVEEGLSPSGQQSFWARVVEFITGKKA
jgi:hypothetical protein